MAWQAEPEWIKVEPAAALVWVGVGRAAISLEEALAAVKLRVNPKDWAALEQRINHQQQQPYGGIPVATYRLSTKEEIAANLAKQPKIIRLGANLNDLRTFLGLPPLRPPIPQPVPNTQATIDLLLTTTSAFPSYADYVEW